MIPWASASSLNVLAKLPVTTLAWTVAATLLLVLPGGTAIMTAATIPGDVVLRMTPDVVVPRITQGGAICFSKFVYGALGKGGECALVSLAI